jgi:hypothetical protein
MGVLTCSICSQEVCDLRSWGQEPAIYVGDAVGSQTPREQRRKLMLAGGP